MTQLVSRLPAERSPQRWAGYAGWGFGRAAQQPAVYTVTVDGIGTFKAQSFHAPELPPHGKPLRPHDREKESRSTSGSDFTIVKAFDELSSALQMASTEGKHIAKLEIVIEKPPRRIVMRFNDVLVSTYLPRGAMRGEAEQLEEITFNGVFDEKNSRF
jgi:Type VI secretion system effector, Hcp